MVALWLKTYLFVNWDICTVEIFILCLAMYISVSMAIYVPFVSIYHNLKWIGSRVCDASCIEGSKTVYLLTQWCRVLLEKLTGLQLVKKFPIFHGTRRFMTALTSVHHLSILGQPIYSYPTSWRSVLILSTHLCLGLPTGFFNSGFPTKTLHTPLYSPIRNARYITSHLQWRYSPTGLWPPERPPPVSEASANFCG